MKTLLLNTQALAILLPIASLFMGCDGQAVNPAANRPPPVVSVGEGDGYVQRKGLRLIPVGAQVLISPSVRSSEMEEGAGGWRVRTNARMQDDGSGDVTPLAKPFSFRMPDMIIRVDQRVVDRFGGASGDYHSILVPMGFFSNEKFDEWSLILDRRPVHQGTTITFRGLSRSGVDHESFKNLSVTLHYLIDVKVDPPQPGRECETTVIPSKGSTSPNAPVETLGSEVVEIEDRTEMSFTLSVPDSDCGPVSVLLLGVLPSDFSDMDAPSLQIPIANYKDAIMLFTKERPEGVPITPEELKKLDGLAGS
jgi:hypothetical protein